MKKKSKQNIALLALGILAVWWFIRPKEAKAEEVTEEVPKETAKVSVIPPGWYVAEIVPLKDELAQLKIALANLYQEFK